MTSNLPANKIREVKVTLTSAQILDLNSTPVTLIPAQGAGTVIAPLSIIGRVVYNSTPYATNTTLEVYEGGDLVATEVGLLQDTATTVRTFTQQVGSLLSNTDLTITVDTGNPTAGDSDVDIYITYEVITL